MIEYKCVRHMDTGDETMRGAASYYRGLNLGWDWAGEFATASRAEKRALLARLARMGEAYWNEFVRGVQEGIASRSEARYDARKSGLSVRGIRTDRLAAALERLT
jgi:hypothetical protein